MKGTRRKSTKEEWGKKAFVQGAVSFAPSRRCFINIYKEQRKEEREIAAKKGELKKVH